MWLLRSLVSDAAAAEIDLTPMWIDPATYAETLRKVAEDGVKLREYLKQ